MLIPVDPITAYLGDLQHKHDLVLLLNTINSPLFLKLITNSNQAAYLEKYYPQLVPPNNPNGTKPSPHTIATVFEAVYYQRPDLQHICTRRLLTEGDNWSLT